MVLLRDLDLRQGQPRPKERLVSPALGDLRLLAAQKLMVPLRDLDLRQGQPRPKEHLVSPALEDLRLLAVPMLMVLPELLRQSVSLELKAPVVRTPQAVRILWESLPELKLTALTQVTELPTEQMG